MQRTTEHADAMSMFSEDSVDTPFFSQSKINPPTYNPYKILKLYYVIMICRGFLKGVALDFVKKKKRERRKQS